MKQQALEAAVHYTQFTELMNNGSMKPCIRVNGPVELTTILHSWTTYIASGGEWSRVYGFAEDPEGYFWVIYGDENSLPKEEFRLYKHLMGLNNGELKEKFGNPLNLIQSINFGDTRGISHLSGTLIAPPPEYTYEEWMELQEALDVDLNEDEDISAESGDLEDDYVSSDEEDMTISEDDINLPPEMTSPEEEPEPVEEKPKPKTIKPPPTLGALNLPKPKDREPVSDKPKGPPKLPPKLPGNIRESLSKLSAVNKTGTSIEKTSPEDSKLDVQEVAETKTPKVPEIPEIPKVKPPEIKKPKSRLLPPDTLPSASNPEPSPAPIKPSGAPEVVPSTGAAIPYSGMDTSFGGLEEDEYEASTGFLDSYESTDESTVAVYNVKTSEIYSIGQSPVVLGRSPKSSTHVVSTDSTVSRQHCMLFVDRGKLVAVDMNSSNGVIIGNTKISPNTQTICPPRSLIKLGNVLLTVEGYEDV